MFKKIITLTLVLCVCAAVVHAQGTAKKKRVLIDIAHNQKFYNDPNDMAGKDPAFVDRIRYMTGELSKNASALNAETSFIKTPITSDMLKACDLLFIHMPSAKYSADEVKAIQKYLDNGGSLFIVMEVDYWATLDQANVNEILAPYQITFKKDNPDNHSSGGHNNPGTITTKKRSIPYHGARLVEGGTPFAFSNSTDENPFGVSKEVGKGGKIVAMGEGMVSLYMTSWEGVNDYQCAQFMGEVLGWLLK